MALNPRVGNGGGARGSGRGYNPGGRGPNGQYDPNPRGTMLREAWDAGIIPGSSSRPNPHRKKLQQESAWRLAASRRQRDQSRLNAAYWQSYNSFAPDRAALQAERVARASNAWGNLAIGDLTQRRFSNNIAGIGHELAYNRGNWESAQARANIANRGLDIDDAYLARQTNYINEIYRLAAQDYGIQDAIKALDAEAVERQFPLIAKAREDITRLHNILQQDIAARGEIATRDERIKQLDMISQAAAAGSAGSAMGILRAREVAAQLQDELADGQRRREEAQIQYQAALRENDEQMAQARDAKERIRLERQRIEIERQRAERERIERLAQIEDDKKRAALERFNIALQLQDAQRLWAYQQQQARNAIAEQNYLRWIAGIQTQQDHQNYLAWVGAQAQREAEIERRVQANAANILGQTKYPGRAAFR